MAIDPKVLKSEDLISEIYNLFDPFDPPPEEAYVDCGAVRGDWNVFTELGRKITRTKGIPVSYTRDIVA